VKSADELTQTIEKLNNDDSVHGIMVMYPSGYGIKDTTFMNMINPLKDIEGLHNSYLGYLVQFEKFRDPDRLRKLVIPPTAKGVLSILKRYAIDYDAFYQERGFYPENVETNPFDLEGKRVTVINDSLAVGRSMALMLLNENAYVQVCHEYTPFEMTLESVKNSDVVISAVPSSKFKIPTEFVPEKAIIIDISFEGNFDYPSVIEKCYKIAPRWDLVKKGNRINDMTLNRLISNLHYLVNASLPEETLKAMNDLT
jgi:5,10-methylene-tetrahydrofolate dehydrogenase/methenyl tetrahydrofolate cyclohydrolase